MHLSQKHRNRPHGLPTSPRSPLSFERNESLVLVDDRTRFNVHRLDHTVNNTAQALLHLHGLKHADHATCRHLVAHLHLDVNDSTRHGSQDELRGVDDLLRWHVLRGASLQSVENLHLVWRSAVLHLPLDLVCRDQLEGLLHSGLVPHSHLRHPPRLTNLPVDVAEGDLPVPHSADETVVGVRDGDNLRGIAKDAVVRGRLRGWRAGVPAGAVPAGTDEAHGRSHCDNLEPLISGELVACETLRISLRKVICGDITIHVALLGQDVAHKTHVVLHTANHVAVQGVFSPVNTLLTGLPLRDELRDHGIVVDGDLRPLCDSGVDANAGSRRLHVTSHPPDRRGIVPRRVLRVHAALRRMTVDLDLILRHGQGQSTRCAKHFVDQVKVGDFLGNGVLNLQPGVHFQEVEVPAAVHKHLHCPGSVVTHHAGEGRGLLTHRLAGLGVDETRGGLLDHLLVTTLDGALALRQVHSVTALVRDDLDLDVAGVVDELLHQHPVVAEGRQGLTLRRNPLLPRLLLVPGNAQTLATATGTGFDHDGIAH
eukprot:Hpha_TRINITY_DN14154_c0_g1::TRINITY_DN14154_c0_g1_i1::g.10939::m.10939